MENPAADAASRRENRSYVMINRHLRSRGAPLPEMVLCDMAKGWFLLEDVGDISLQEWANQPRRPLSMYERVIEVLLQLQLKGAEGFDPGWTCQTESYDRRVMLRYESDYFRKAFLENYLGLRESGAFLAPSFEHIARKASRAKPLFFLHRDFQSRNIMIHEGGVWVIDWQGGRLGPLAYDLASLLIDPYTGLREEERAHLFRYYLEGLDACCPREVDSFRSSYPYLAIQRGLQILGAFAYLTRVRKKAHFAPYIPPALHTLSGLLAAAGDPRLAELTAFVRSLKAAP